MRKIDLIKVIRNILIRFWFPVLLAVIGAIGMYIGMYINQNVETQSIAKTVSWELDHRYAINVELEDVYKGYLYQKDLAQSACELLNADIELQDIAIDKEKENEPLLDSYSITCENRRIKLHLKGKEETRDLIEEIQKSFESKAQWYLEKESNGNATFESEHYSFEKKEIEIEPVLAPISKKKMILLGSVVGFCIGMALLLLKEYACSPKV